MYNKISKKVKHDQLLKKKKKTANCYHQDDPMEIDKVEMARMNNKYIDELKENNIKLY